MALALTSLLVLAVLAAPLARRLGDAAGWVLALPFLGAFVHLLTRVEDVVSGRFPTLSLGSVPVLDVELTLRLDGLGLLFALLVTLVGACVVVHAGGYLAGKPRVLGRFVAIASVFAAAMTGLVLADDLLLLFVCWELTSVCSFLLVGLLHEGEDARSGASRALLVTGAGGVALLVGVLLLAAAGDTTSITTLVERGDQVRSSGLYLPALLCLLAGAFTKSAQVPFHYWLPGAMAAPSPVSAFLHSATLVKAGVFLLLRLHPVLGPTEAWHVILGHAGVLTLLVGAVLAFSSDDLKRLLAYTTVAGLGTLVLLIGIGTEAALRAALLFVAVHALYKASLFMVVGYLDKRVGTRDVGKLAGLARSEPAAFAAAALAALSMTGLPPLLGAIAKELIHEAKIGAPEAPLLFTVAGTTGNLLVVGAALLVAVRPFLGRGEPPAAKAVARVRLLAGPCLLAVVGLALGTTHQFWAGALVEVALESLEGGAETPEFRAATERGDFDWLGKSTLAAGVVAYLLRRHLLRAGAWIGHLARIGPTRLHDRALATLFATGRFVARGAAGDVVRSTTAIVGLLVAGLGVAWIASGHAPVWPAASMAIGVHHGLILALTGAGALVTLVSRRPITAVAALGVSGIGVALLFLLSGGPDLALTQIAVETLAVLLLLSVMRNARPSSRPESGGRRLAALLLSVGVGVTFTLLAWAATPDGAPRPLSEAVTAASHPEAFGRNVVNVILVDFRALDTLGEVFVLAIAALGVAALLRPVGPSPTSTAPVSFRSPVLRAAARSVVPVLVLLSLVLFVRGHHEPGGGFVGGLVAASAALLHGLVFGPRVTRRALRPESLVGIGLGLVLLSGVPGLVAGDGFLDGLWLPFRVPGIGKLGTPLVFDAGVYLVVVGVATSMLFALVSAERARVRPSEVTS